MLGPIVSQGIVSYHVSRVMSDNISYRVKYRRVLPASGRERAQLRGSDSEGGGGGGEEGEGGGGCLCGRRLV